MALELDESRAMKAELGSKRSWPCSLPLLHMSAGSLPASGLNERGPTCTISILLPAEHCSPVTLGQYYSKHWVFIQNSVSTGSLAFQDEKGADISIFSAFQQMVISREAYVLCSFSFIISIYECKASKTR